MKKIISLITLFFLAYFLTPGREVRYEKNVYEASSEVDDWGEHSQRPDPAVIKEWIGHFAQHYEIDRDLFTRIAVCENRSLDPFAVGSKEDGGIYQFLPSTFIETRKRMGKEAKAEFRFRFKENIEAAAFKISQDGTSAWASSRHCWR